MYDDALIRPWFESAVERVPGLSLFDAHAHIGFNVAAARQASVSRSRRASPTQHAIPELATEADIRGSPATRRERSEPSCRGDTAAVDNLPDRQHEYCVVEE